MIPSINFYNLSRRRSATSEQTSVRFVLWNVTVDVLLAKGSHFFSVLYRPENKMKIFIIHF